MVAFDAFIVVFIFCLLSYLNYSWNNCVILLDTIDKTNKCAVGLKTIYKNV